MEKWSHLPNADHIDRILAHSRKNLQLWHNAAGLAAGLSEPPPARVPFSAWEAAWDAARATARATARDTALDAAWDAVQGLVGNRTAWSPIMALIAWDHAGKYMNMHPDQLRMQYELSNDPACLLMLPALFAMQTNEMESTIT